MREMKDSGIEWIGEIPKDWKCCKVKNSTSFVGSGTTPTSSNQDFYDGDINWIQSGDLYKTVVVDTVEKKLTEKALKSFSALHIYQAPFIVMAMYGASVGNTAFSKIDACCNQACCCIKNNEFFDLKFMYYWLDFAQIDFLGRAIGGTQPNISQDKIKNQYIVKPSLEEQQQIANYLDTKCSEINTTAEDIQKEISLLEDYKKSLIYNVISNGINHSAYSTETDEVWGNVPQGWKLVDIKYLFEIVKRIAGKEGYDVLSVTQKGLKVKDITSGDGQLADNYSGYQFVYPTDYVMNHMDLLTGWVDCSELFGVTSPDYRVFRLMDKAANNLFYYKYVMQCCYMNKIFYSLGQGVSNLGRWRLQTSSFNNFKVPVPPKAEQDEIADFLDTKCSEIDTLIADKKRQLDILADYKKSLIYEYVTGKKEVPVNE